MARTFRYEAERYENVDSRDRKNERNLKNTLREVRARVNSDYNELNEVADILENESFYKDL
jgi:hypothetical protein